MTIGETIKYYREEKQLTQKQLADLVDFSKNTLGLYERDKVNISLFNAISIVEALGITLNDLLSLSRR